MTTRAEVDTVKAILDASPSMAGRVFVTEAYDRDGKPLIETPYWVIHPAGGSDSQTRLTGDYAEHEASFVIHSVHDDADGALWGNEQVDGALRPRGRGVIPLVPGRRTDPVRRDALLPVDVDRDSTPSLVFVPAEYAFTSAPA